MTKRSPRDLANQDGGMCALGAAGWTSGIPLDRLGDTWCPIKLLKVYRQIEAHLGITGETSNEIFYLYDEMCSCIATEHFDHAISRGEDLLAKGWDHGINFIIASPLDGKLKEIRKQQRRAAQLELTAH